MGNEKCKIIDFGGKDFDFLETTAPKQYNRKTELLLKACEIRQRTKDVSRRIKTDERKNS